MTKTLLKTSDFFQKSSRFSYSNITHHSKKLFYSIQFFQDFPLLNLMTVEACTFHNHWRVTYIQSGDDEEEDNLIYEVLTRRHTITYLLPLTSTISQKLFSKRKCFLFLIHFSLILLMRVYLEKGKLYAFIIFIQWLDLEHEKKTHTAHMNLLNEK